MKAKYYVMYPETAGQWCGYHWFFTMRERTNFVVRAGERGAPMPQKIGKIAPKKRRK